MDPQFFVNQGRLFRNHHRKERRADWRASGSTQGFQAGELDLETMVPVRVPFGLSELFKFAHWTSLVCLLDFQDLKRHVYFPDLHKPAPKTCA